MLIRGLGAPETIEDVGEQFICNSRARVADDDLALTPCGTYRDLRPATTRCEFDGVAEQVPDHLLQPLRAAEYQAFGRRQVLLEDDALARSRGLQDIHRRLDNLADIRFLRVHADLPGRHGAEVEEIVHDVGEQAGIAGYSLATRAGFLDSEPAELHQARPAENSIQGGAQLVAQGFQKLIFQPATALGFDTGGALVVEQGS